MFAAKNTAAPSGEAVYIESVFSTYLYTGDGTNKTLNLGIDLAGKGGLTWIKSRNNLSTVDHLLFDTARGNDLKLSSNLTAASQNQGAGCWSPTSTGFTVNNGFQPNYNGTTYASWTFREQAKFFDVVTFTASAAAAYTFNHNLGSTPGFVIIKPTSVAGAWYCYHTSLGVNKYLLLNTTDASGTNPSGNWAATSTTFTVPTDFLSGGTQTYVAYLFAHDAGGFGATGTDNVISCGSVTNTTTVNLGYEPQWIMVKRTDSTSPWYVVDNMRGMNASYGDYYLAANSSAAEALGGLVAINATGMTLAVVGTCIYIAIRRGPMKTPTSGTSVFTPNVSTTTDITGETFTVGFPPDSVWPCRRNDSSKFDYDRLRGQNYLVFNTTGAENNLDAIPFDQQNSFKPTYNFYQASPGVVLYSFRRAPGFFDVVCYTGTGSATTQTHNLGAAPELLIVKSRDTAVNWVVWASAPTPQQNQYALNLNTAGTWGSSGDKIWGATLTGAPNMTSTTFSLGDYVGVNGSAKTYVAYLFASVTGVSKVGSYTGTGTTLQVDCGFTAGSRFVMIKRTDSAGNWVTFDTARGIVSGNDPALYLNSTAAEVTGIDAIDPDNSGFIVNQETTFNLNVNAATYIYLAIA